MKRPDPLVVVVGLVAAAAFLGAWKLYVVHWDVSPFLLPPPEATAPRSPPDAGRSRMHTSSS